VPKKKAEKRGFERGIEGAAVKHIDFWNTRKTTGDHGKKSRNEPKEIGEKKKHAEHLSQNSVEFEELRD